MPQPKKKPVPIKFDAHINDLLEITLHNFFGNSEDNHDKWVTSSANLCWLLGKLTESPQFTVEQKSLLKQITQTWHDGLQMPELTDEEEK